MEQKIGFATVKSMQKYELILVEAIKWFSKTCKPFTHVDLLSSENLSYIKPATVRHYLLLLEKDGMLDSPEDVLGRIPSQQAMTWYISKILKDIDVSVELPLKAGEKYQLNESNAMIDISVQIAYAADILASNIKQPVFFSMPKLPENSIYKIKLFKVHKNTYLIVSINQIGDVQSKIVYSRHNFIEENLYKIQDVVSMRIMPVNRPFRYLSKEESMFAEEVYQQFNSMQLGSESEHQGSFLYTGISYMNQYDSTFSANAMANMMHIIDNKHIQKNLLHIGSKAFPIAIVKGQDLEEVLGFDTTRSEELHIGICMSRYNLNDTPVGCVCTISPWFVDYDKIITNLTEATYNISKLIEQQVLSYKEHVAMKLISNKNKLLAINK